MKQSKKMGICSILICSSFSFCFLGVQRLVAPKYVESVVEGRLIGEYYQSEKNHQVIFLGDCEVYENFSPVTLWETQGVTSFVRGGPQQLIWQSYYLLEETLRYEVPEVVVFNVLSMKYGFPQSEPYNRLNLDGMRWSSSKVGAVKASMMGEESVLSYLFPLFRYHERIVELTGEDFSSYFGVEELSHNGYLMQVGVKPVTVIPSGDLLANTAFHENSYEYLDRMVALCEAYGVELVLVKAPTVYPYWYEEWDLQMVGYAEEHGLRYFNFLALADEIGIDFSVDTYDGGLHLNVDGAEKLTAYFGERLQEEFDLVDHRGDEAISGIWRGKVLRYEEEKNNKKLEEISREEEER